MDLKTIFNYPLLEFGETVINVYNLVGILVIFIVTKTILWLLKRIIKQRINAKKFDAGRGLAIFQIAKYVIITGAILFAIDSLGINIGLLLAGSAALLVGVGLGLQQTFNDLISGVILLFEGSVTVGDIVEINGIVAKVMEINIRVSKIETREGISILVPNSKLTNDYVINWSHNRSDTRFSLKVGVAYGSDVEKVRTILVQTAAEHPDVASKPEPNARFTDFGDSALAFELIYWSSNMFNIEQIKSDLRFEIDKQFRNQNITIPFPQRDLHIKTGTLID
jgi:small-conductance mechanosensitive channel